MHPVLANLDEDPKVEMTNGARIWEFDGTTNAWIEELQDAYESGFDSYNQTIYYRNEVVNQFEGIRDVDLACKIGQLLKVNVARIVQQQVSRVGVVREIREAIEEGDY